MLVVKICTMSHVVVAHSPGTEYLFLIPALSRKKLVVIALSYFDSDGSFLTPAGYCHLFTYPNIFHINFHIN